ncbi:MAG: hypothetical protein HZB25_00335 [Candidatus Eisenbacteria bacterium]|nr:hypothetical protein [Candidatus Eisenbacteria bacterium]
MRPWARWGVGMRSVCACLAFACLAGALRPEPARAETTRGRAALMSLLLPGWGQSKLGDTRMAAVFGGVEAAGWISYITFRRQVALRHDSQVLYAKLHARVDVDGKGATYERDVGSFLNSDEFNRAVVLFNAEAIYAGEADPARRLELIRNFVRLNSYSGSDGWNWDTNASRIEYLKILKSGLSANRNGNFAFGAVVANHLLSAADALRPRRARGEKLGVWDVVPSVALRADGSPALVWSAGF